MQDFHCFGVGGAEPVGFTGVELGHLARPESDLALPEDEAELASEHVEPFVAGVGYQSRFAVREYLLEDLDPARVLRQRDEDASAFPAPRLQMDPRITGGRSRHQLVQRDAVGAGERDEKVERRAPPARLQARQRAHGDPGVLREGFEGEAAVVPQGAQSWPDAVEEFREFGVHAAILQSSQSSWAWTLLRPEPGRQPIPLKGDLPCSRHPWPLHPPR